MANDLSSITPEQWAKLFPIIIEPHKPEWKMAFCTERDVIKTLLGEKAKRVRHFGSTAIASLAARPIVDMLVEIDDGTDVGEITRMMEEAGYTARISKNENDLALFLKGYTPQGFEGQAFNVYLRRMGDWPEIPFRDTLSTSHRFHHDYGNKKIELAAQFEHDEDAYIAARQTYVEGYYAAQGGK